MTLIKKHNKDDENDIEKHNKDRSIMSLKKDPAFEILRPSRSDSPSNRWDFVNLILIQKARQSLNETRN